MGFQKKFVFQNNQQMITNKIQASDFMHILYFQSLIISLNSA